MDTGTEVKRVILDSSGDKGKTKARGGSPGPCSQYPWKHGLVFPFLTLSCHLVVVVGMDGACWQQYR